MRAALDRIYDAAGYLAAFFVFAIFAVMIGGTALRELGLRSGGSDDIVAWFCAAAAFLAMAHTFRRGDFVRVMLGLERLGPVARRRMELLCLLVMVAFTGVSMPDSRPYVQIRPLMAPISVGRPRSRSCSIDERWEAVAGTRRP